MIQPFALLSSMPADAEISFKDGQLSIVIPGDSQRFSDLCETDFYPDVCQLCVDLGIRSIVLQIGKVRVPAYDPAKYLLALQEYQAFAAA